MQNSDFRNRAEAIINKRFDADAVIPAADVKELVHELRVHQIELEMQNEELRQAQLDLAESRDRYSVLYDSAPVGYITVDTDGLILESNATAAALLNTEEAESLLRRNLSDFIFRNDQDIWFQYRRKLRTGRMNTSCELTMLQEGGTPFNARLTGTSRGTGTVPADQILIAFTDNTSLKRAQTAVDESEKRYNLALKSAGIGLWDWDINMNRVIWNKTMYELRGVEYSEGKVEFDRFFENIHPDDRSMVEDEIRSTVRSGEELQTEFRVCLSDGEVRWLVARGSMLIGEDHIPVRMIGVNFDITDRRLAQEHLQLSEEKFRAFFENAPEYCYMVSPGGLILDVNNSALCALGYDRGELVGEPIEMIYDPASRRKMKKRFKQWRKTGKLKDEEMTIQTQEGEKRTVLLSADTVRDKERNVIHSISIQRDITERKRLERRVEYLSRFPAENPAPVIRIQEDGVLRYANPAARVLLNSLGMKVDEVVPEFWHDLIRKTLKQDKLNTIEMDFGNETFSLNFTPVSELSYCNIYGTRITEMKELNRLAQEAGILAAASKTALDTIESMEEGVALISMEGVIGSVNPALARLTGYSREYLEGKKAADLIPEILDTKDIPRAAASLVHAQSGKPQELGEMMLISKDCVRIPIIPRVVFIRDEQDKPALIVMTIQDISAIEDAHRSIREQAERLAEAQRIAHLGNWERDIGTDNLTWSPEVYRIFGLDPEESDITYDVFIESVHPEDRKSVEAAADDALKNKEPYSVDYRIVLSPGIERYIHEQGTLMEDRAGTVLRIIGTVQDITERHQMELALGVQDKLASLGRVAAGIAHEIRNPLSGIQVFIDTILMKFREENGEPDPEWIVNILGKVIKTSHRIESVIKRVMDFARPALPRFSGIDINRTVREALDLSLVLLQKVGIEIETDFADSLPECSADMHLISQVMLNLILNSAEAMKSLQTRKKMRIITRREGRNIQIILDDNGPGVPDDLKEKIFEPFFTTKQEGTGIGLSMCRRIISDHSGGLFVYDSEWGGAEFLVTLPAGLQNRV